MTTIKFGLRKIAQLDQLDVRIVIELNNWLYDHTGSGYRWIENDLEIDDDEIATLFRLRFGL